MASFAAVAAVTAVLGAVGTAVETREAGIAADKQARMKARVESDRAAGEQINVRQNMLRALASQNAGTLGSVGTGAATGFGANARRQINQNQNDLLVSKANASAQVSLLDMAGRDASDASSIAAGAGLLSSLGSAYKANGGGGAPSSAGGPG